ncbi:hypothetical protein LTR99_010293 [Exophiala xenobiotica]|uniref:Glycoside hydrolase family 31 protein n=1 Tax=Vermiconidia calcicola TaxID=1690605 RepID=A0AAV9Q2N0_9PEZI|nr:hypothetical protein LTR47_010380 [Exophiala xenobiotica]KAK5534012.1 hypothetical protein LTR25_006992 [Vermiconidia calcicola]KAK5534928.1 hypothetical protein LTR23_008603 [Chaetothyriales sp. CCFEE 6169]KAK5252577.1 hypothetical protein LTS06_002984 [Exophiala xenobiotica]KAK5292545.1 hypothetical protein LTR99_010293 [Exophiala xenobiotica]
MALANVSVTVSGTNPFALTVKSDQGLVVTNNAILSGSTNNTATAISASSDGTAASGGGAIDWTIVQPNVVKVQYNATAAFTGASFTASPGDNFYGVWEYPWNDSLTNNGIEFDLKGVGNGLGINWDNARAPAFYSSAGFGVYADSLDMGSFHFTAGQAQFIFNTSSLTYYIILAASPGDYKSIIETYTGLSARITMPPDSGYGPTFWSDNFEQDFHGTVSNAQENYYDVVNHLFYNQIRATSMFADRPYGTGNYSWGNFDFDPEYYPTPDQFIANLSTWGFDFQVWAANRAFLDTELYNVSAANGWLFPGINPEYFLGPALNLSIPAAYEYFLERMSYFPSVGVKGFKIDRGEEGEMPVYEQNIQMQLFEQICETTMANKWGKSGFYNFARSAVDRSRSLTNIWNGDSHANFTGLRYSIASGIRAGLLGFSTWSSDTGGYVRANALVADQPTPEVWARWMHFSSYSPVYEIMVGTNHTPWYAPYPSRLVDVLKRTANEHHSLIPYIRSFTYQANVTGVPVMRALFLETPEDNGVYDTTDAYFFGDSFFVAPITSEGGARSVYFPGAAQPGYGHGNGHGNASTSGTAGRAYLEYYNKTVVQQAGSSATVVLEWEESPVYVREGSVVVKGDVYQGNNKWTGTDGESWSPSLTIEVYPTYKAGYAEASFPYYTGKDSEVVGINVVADEKAKTVTVQWSGDLGVPGTPQVVVYGKSGARNGTVTAPVSGKGGKVIVEGFESIFG